MPMRLFHITTVPISLAFLSRQAAFIRKHGFTVHAISSPGPALEAFAAAEQVHSHGVLMKRSISPLSDLAALLRLLYLFLRYRPDIVHAHTPKGGLLAMIAAWLTRVPIRVFNVHGHPHSTADGLLRKILKWSTRISCAAATRVLCVSDSALNLAIAERICAREKATVAARGSSNGVDAIGKFTPASDNGARSRSLLGLTPATLTIGFAGRLVRDKGVGELHEAWLHIRSRFPTAHLLIAGEPEVRDSLPPSLLESLRKDDRVHMLGWLKQMRVFYEAIDVLALPSYREGFPNVLLEAAAMQVPVVATRCVGCRDAVVEGVTGLLVDVGDAAALTFAIESYLSNPDLRHQHGVAARARVLADFRPEDVWLATLREYQKLSAEHASARSRSLLRAFVKRLVDIVLGSAALLFLSPLLTLAAVLVRLSSGSPVFFRQRRPGLNGHCFEIIKFRTMRHALDASGRPLPDAARLTKLGRFLRSSSLDELPELWNVIRGEMSLVGPRPLLPEYIARYNQHQQRRHAVKPGITGWAQINGRNALSWEEKLDCDVWYVDHQSLLLDLRILWLTLLAVLLRKGISHEGHATMPEFTGTADVIPQHD